MKPGGAIAAWTYYTPVFDSSVDSIIERLVHDVLGAYWDKRLHYVDEFHDLPFSFEPIEAPSTQTDMKWDNAGPSGLFGDVVILGKVPPG